MNGLLQLRIIEWDEDIEGYFKDLEGLPLLKAYNRQFIYFSAENLEDLLIGLFKIADKAPDAAFSFEGHPNNTTKSHLTTLYRNGFTRVCYGVQDYNLEVQKAINRIQPFENVKAATENARNVGYQSVGHDVVFGLPFQTVTHVVKTIQKTILLKPDRIAFYSYAHVPWIKGNGQRGYSEEHLPSPDEKWQQYEIGRDLLLEAGYVEIGMDHFALPTDSLNMAKQTKTLHRNFMGYTTSKTNVMIGLGVSAIGDSWYGFAQNVKSLKEYYQLLSEDQLPLLRGHILTEEDLVIRKHILNIMCHFQTDWKQESEMFTELPQSLTLLEEIAADELIDISNNSIQVRKEARPFIRNICMAFDMRLQRKQPETKLFSMTI